MTTVKTLWIEASGLTDSEIRAACAPAEAAILAAGYTVGQAYQASLAECDGRDFDAGALAAWQAADRIALAEVADERAILSVA